MDEEATPPRVTEPARPQRASEPILPRPAESWSPKPKEVPDMAYRPSAPTRIQSGMQVETPRYAPVSRPGSRRERRVIRRVDPLSVLKFSAVFYSSVMLIFLLAGAILYFAATGAGIIDKTEQFIQGIGWPTFRIRAIQVFRIGLLIGLTQVTFWTLVNVFAAFLYNLVADLVGGIEVTMTDQDY